MKIVKIILIFVLVTFFSIKADAQIVNGDFEAGTSSWSWAQSPVNGGPCSSVQVFTPVLNGFVSDVPYKFNGYGRSAKIDGGQNTFASTAFFCRKISQIVFVPIGSKLKYDIWTNAGRATTFPSSYSGATVSVTLQDTASSLSKIYTGTPSICSTCNTPVDSGLDFGSEFWGKTVKLTFTTSTEYRRGIPGGSYLYDASVYIDNIALVKPVIANVQPKTGAWYNPSRSGHGFHISKASDGRYIAMWYSYLSNGKPIWYISDPASVINGVLNTKIYKSTWNYTTQTNTRVAVGDIRFEMHNNSLSTFSWDLYSFNGDSPADFDGAEPMRYLIGGDAYTGLWYEPALSGYGYSVDQRASGAYSAVTAFYYENGEPVWARGEKAIAPTGNASFPMTAFTGIGLCPECNGQTITRTPLAVGEVGLSLDTNKSWLLLQNAAAATVWQRGLPLQPVDTARLTFP